MKTKKNMLLMLFAMMVTLSSQAEQKGDTRPYTMTGILRAMTICHVNNDQIITADFKNVGINKLETEVYSLPLDYTLDCPVLIRPIHCG